MKKKIITLLVFAAIGFSVYFIYDKMLCCKSACSSPCENKDSVAVATIKKDSVPTCTVTSTVAETSTVSAVSTTVSATKK